MNARESHRKTKTKEDRKKVINFGFVLEQDDTFSVNEQRTLLMKSTSDLHGCMYVCAYLN